MSRRVPGVVETSNNLGIVDLRPDSGYANFMVRSLLDEGSRALGEEIASLFWLSKTAVSVEGGYSGWAPTRTRPCWHSARMSTGASSAPTLPSR